MKLSEAQHTFISHFGTMGTRWGINRTMGEIYALLYIIEQPLHRDDIAEALSFSASTVSKGLKELDGWGLILVKHFPKDRKDYYTVPEDIWVIVRTLVAERKKREIDPTLAMLEDIISQKKDGGKDAYALKKMKEMHEVISMLTAWYTDIQKLDTKRVVNLLKLGSKVYNFLSGNRNR